MNTERITGSDRVVRDTRAPDARRHDAPADAARLLMAILVPMCLVAEISIALGPGGPVAAAPLAEHAERAEPAGEPGSTERAPAERDRAEDPHTRQEPFNADDLRGPAAVLARAGAVARNS